MLLVRQGVCHCVDEFQGVAAVHSAFALFGGGVNYCGGVQPLRGYLSAEPELAAAHVVYGFQRRTGGTQHNLRSVYAAQHHGHVSRVEARSWGFLLVRRVLLLLHYHQPQFAVRQEKYLPASLNYLRGAVRAADLLRQVAKLGV